MAGRRKMREKGRHERRSKSVKKRRVRERRRKKKKEHTGRCERATRAREEEIWLDEEQKERT